MVDRLAWKCWGDRNTVRVHPRTLWTFHSENEIYVPNLLIQCSSLISWFNSSNFRECTCLAYAHSHVHTLGWKREYLKVPKTRDRDGIKKQHWCRPKVRPSLSFTKFRIFHSLIVVIFVLIPSWLYLLLPRNIFPLAYIPCAPPPTWTLLVHNSGLGPVNRRKSSLYIKYTLIQADERQDGIKRQTLSRNTQVWLPYGKNKFLPQELWYQLELAAPWISFSHPVISKQNKQSVQIW